MRDLKEEKERKESESLRKRKRERERDAFGLSNEMSPSRHSNFYFILYVRSVIPSLQRA